MSATEQVVLFSAKEVNQGLDFTTPIQKVLNSHWYVLGDEVKNFEKEFAQYVGVKHCVSVASGSDALELALRCLGIKSGDSVVTVANAGFYSSTAIHAIGAKPIYVDVEENTLTLCPKALEAIIHTKPAAIVVTHLYGQLANIEELVRIAHDAKVPILEDCAQAHGAKRNGQLAGSFGDIACFSFYPTKNFGALGDGGAVVTNNHDLSKCLLQLRQYGWSKKYLVSISGGRNSRLDEMQAAILRIKLPHLDACNNQRRSIAERYNLALANLNIKLPRCIDESYVAHLYVIRTSKRSDLAAFLNTQKISTDIHYPVPDHQQPAYLTESKNPLSITETACETVISLPCYPGLSDEKVLRVISAVTHFFQQES